MGLYLYATGASRQTLSLLSNLNLSISYSALVGSNSHKDNVEAKKDALDTESRAASEDEDEDEDEDDVEVVGDPDQKDHGRRRRPTGRPRRATTGAARSLVFIAASAIHARMSSRNCRTRSEIMNV